MSIKFSLLLSLLFISVLGYVDPKLPKGNTTSFSIVLTPYNFNIFAFGEDRTIYHKSSPIAKVAFTDWVQLYSDNSTKGQPLYWDNDPVACLAADNRIHLFMRSVSTLDVWVGFQDIASLKSDKPTFKTEPIESGKLGDKKWIEQPVFPTSDVSCHVNNNLITLYYRGFDGALYTVTQSEPSSEFYNPPVRYETILE